MREAPVAVEAPKGRRDPTMRGLGLLDVHAHFLTPDYVAAALRAGHAQPDGMPSWPSWDADSHLALLDRYQIDRALLSISSPGVHFGNSAAAVALARHVNDTAAAHSRAHPDRFGFLAALPLPDVDATLQEMARAFDELDAAGVVVLTHTRGIYLSDPRLEPVLAALNERRAVVLVHPTSPPTRPLVPHPLPMPVLEFGFDTTRTVTDLVLSGALQRYPELRLVIPHGGAALPLLADRIHAFSARLAQGGDPVDSPPLQQQLRQLWYDTAGTPFPHQIPALTGLVGQDHVVYGSDYCWTPPDAVGRQLRSLHQAAPPIGYRDWAALTTHNAHLLLQRD